MEFKNIVSVSGMPGLHELVTTKNNGIIVKSLEDGKSQFVSTRIQGVSSLDNIAVYLKNDETTELRKVFVAMLNKESELPLPDSKGDPKTFENYFRQILPDYDEEKVHLSDMKKMVKWFGILKENNLIPREELEKAEATPESKEVKDEEEKPNLVE